VGRIGRTERAALVASGLVLVLAGAACGGDGGGEAATSEPGTTNVPTQTGAETTEPATTAAEEPNCDADVLFPVVRQAVGESVESVEVVRCRDGYARATARPDESRCPPECFETADVLLRWDGNSWSVVDYGTSIACEDIASLPPAPEDDRRVCEALGYPQPAVLGGPAFQLPSRNIGCRAGGGALRCDILSGLVPEPDEPCELDWVGVVLPAARAAEPNCAGDTVYDGAAPVLAYGDLWHRGAFWCRSSEAGLACVNRDVTGSLELARERWSAN
jgi:hypothetical protein